MDTGSNIITEPQQRMLMLTRVMEASPARVFEAWTNSMQMTQWFGPYGFANPVCELDARPGGAIHIDMCGPDGVLYPNAGVYHEVIAPERLVFSLAWLDTEDNPLINALNTVTFAEHDGVTTLTIQVRVIKAAPEAADALSGMEEGWSQTLDRLADFLASY